MIALSVMIADIVRVDISFCAGVWGGTAVSLFNDPRTFRSHRTVYRSSVGVYRSTLGATLFDDGLVHSYARMYVN